MSPRLTPGGAPAARPLLTPLEPWIAAKIGRPTARPHPDLLRAYQLEAINRTLAVARRSRFYSRLLADHLTELRSLDDLTRLPFTTADDIRADPYGLLTVRQDDVDRIVTLPTSGTTGAPKRILFTAADQELTRDFFHIGMSTMVGPGDRVLILLPGGTPGSVGALLKEGLARMDVEGIIHGPILDDEAGLRCLLETRPTCMVGIPVQVLGLALATQALLAAAGSGSATALPAGLTAEATAATIAGIRCVLMATDRVPRPLARSIERIWDCTVFDHYGTTEMGLGGGVDCEARVGYHLREADLYFEIVDPVTGAPLPDGESGEVVFTTLTRQAMPLVRYRMGDRARFVPGPCPCGTVLRRLEHIDRRLTDGVALPDGVLRQRDLDDALFTLDGLVDFRAEVLPDTDPVVLRMRLKTAPGYARPTHDEVMCPLLALPALAALGRSGRLRLELLDWTGQQADTGTGKRSLKLLLSPPSAGSTPA